MKLLKRLSTVTVRGQLDQAHLDQLCRNLGLETLGTPSAPIGTELGRRIEAHPRFRTVTAVVISVTRTGADEWTVTVDTIPSQEFARWRTFPEIAVRASGLTVHPPHVPSPLTISPGDTADRPLVDASAPSDRTTPEPTAAPDAQASSTSESAMDDDELLELVDGMRNHVWAWRMDDLGGLGRFANRWLILRFEPGRIVFDTQAVPGECYLIGSNGDVVAMDVPVAAVSATSEPELSRLQAITNRMAAVLISRYGEPTLWTSRPYPHIRWRDAKNSLILSCEPPCVRIIVEPERAADDVGLPISIDEAIRRRGS
ncbi:DUF6301 family protein [Nocardia sp. alder85J]|uniref:DUF6301 family protein n=1 Tax=Nocardia sp. alder85J TaxID=2862949 RepID=UPI001CD62246|nr:DUF6301 family protein [Nocardia sp. alder85J]MCX4093056.1 DUF6301 family protein [Nocardia sp. alder85J]